MTEPSPGLRGLQYAESVLGVHEVHDGAVSARNELERVQKRLHSQRAARRQAESDLRDREMVVAEEIHRIHASESQAARDRLLKVAINNDGDVREIRDDLASLAGELDFLEMEESRLTLDIKIAVARMQELGGYFQYLTVIKQAELNSQPPQADRNPWT